VLCEELTDLFEMERRDDVRHFLASVTRLSLQPATSVGEEQVGCRSPDDGMRRAHQRAVCGS